MPGSAFPHLPALVEHQALRHSREPAISVNDEPPLTYGEWWRRSTVLARALRTLIEPGEPIALPYGAESWCEFAESYIACQLAGGIPMPAKPGLPESEWHRLVRECRIGRVVTADPAAVPSAIHARIPVHGHDDLWATARRRQPDPGPGTEVHRIANILLSSGTTGSSKAVAVTHEELLGGSALPANWAGLTLVHVMSPASAAGIEGAMLLALKSALHATTVHPVEPVELVRKLRHDATRVVLLLPSVALMCLRAGQLAEPSRSPRMVTLMGSATPPGVLAELQGAFPRARVLSHYGATEAGSAQLLMPFDASRPRAAGRPMGDTEVRVVGQHGQGLPAGVQGEVLLRRRGAPQRLFLSQDSESVVFGDDGWVHTGDIGYLDDEGYLYVVDRKKDIVVRGGQNIAPSEVEDALVEHPAVREAAAFGIPHELWGEMLVAAVVSDDPAEVSAVALRKFLRTRLAPYKVPSRITFVRELPRNDLGKVRRTQLRSDHLARTDDGRAQASPANS